MGDGTEGSARPGPGAPEPPLGKLCGVMGPTATGKGCDLWEGHEGNHQISFERSHTVEWSENETWPPEMKSRPGPGVSPGTGTSTGETVQPGSKGYAPPVEPPGSTSKETKAEFEARVREYLKEHPDTKAEIASGVLKGVSLTSLDTIVEALTRKSPPATSYSDKPLPEGPPPTPASPAPLNDLAGRLAPWAPIEVDGYIIDPIARTVRKVGERLEPTHPAEAGLNIGFLWGFTVCLMLVITIMGLVAAFGHHG